MPDNSHPIGRRSFLSASAAAIAGAPLIGVLGGLLQSAHADDGDSSSRRYRAFSEHPGSLKVDCVVIGAGFAGINAARLLVQAGKTVAVLEARSRIGGRTKTETFRCGLKFDVGGQWIGPTQKRVTRLAEELGVPTFPTYDTGDNLVELGDTSAPWMTRYHRGIPNMRLHAADDLRIGMEHRLSELANGVNLEEPWNTPNAEHLDSQTLQNWVDANFSTADAKEFCISGMQGVYSAHPNRISLLHALYTVKSAGGLDKLFNVEGAAQARRFKNGTQELLDAMAKPFSDSIYLDAPVFRILQDASGVSVFAGADGSLRVDAKRAIVALAPTLAGRIRYDPILSADRDQLTQTMPMGTTVKSIAVYEKPFWREKGLTGQLFSGRGVVCAAYDNSVPGSTLGALVGLTVGHLAEQIRRMSPDDQQRAITEEYVRFFGPDAANPVEFVFHSFSDEAFSRGCYTAFMPPGVWTSLGQALRRPEGRIHWAGTETSTEWYGYIEGAIQSAERAVAEVLAAR